MPKQPQTISFELAEKLFDKFTESPCSYFYWYQNIQDKSPKIISTESIKIGLNEKIYPAYQLHEILEMLPVRIKTEYAYYFIDLDKDLNKDKIATYCIAYVRNNLLDDKSVLKEFSSNNPTEAAGNLLLWCIENGHVKV